MDLITNKKIKIHANNTISIENKSEKSDINLKNAVKNFSYSTINSSIIKLNTHILSSRLPIFSCNKKPYGIRMYSKYFINPLSKSKNMNEGSFAKSLATMDIETITLNNKQIPIAIALAYNQNQSKLLTINKQLLKSNPESAVKILFNKCLKFLIKNSEYFNNIFIHNLGGFDGYFIYKEFSNLLNINEITPIIDNHNKFIVINIKTKGINIT
jgi:hypothetical protein